MASKGKDTSSDFKKNVDENGRIVDLQKWLQDQRFHREVQSNISKGLFLADRFPDLPSQGPQADTNFNSANRKKPNTIESTFSSPTPNRNKQEYKSYNQLAAKPINP